MNIILGGTSGLGEKIAAQLRERGEDVFVVGRSYDNMVHGQGMSIDLENLQDVEQFVQYIQRMDNNLAKFYWLAGYGYVGDFADQNDALKVGLVNYAHGIPVVQAAWVKMIGHSQGSLVIVSSTSGIKPRANEATYVAAKHAQVGFARSLGMESERVQANIKVSLFMPGGMRTPFWDNNRPEKYDQFLDPSKVASKIIEAVDGQEGPFYEETIERGSL